MKELKHEHNLEPDAAHIYPEHKRDNLSYQKQLAEAANFWSTGASYNEYLRFQARPGHPLDPNAFYNTWRITSL